MPATSVTLHGVLMEILGLGVLLSGASGVGKGDLALELIARGARLIADDAPEFTHLAPGKLYGTCPELLRDFLQVRGLGVLHIPAMFGTEAVSPGACLQLIVHLQPIPDPQAQILEAVKETTRVVLDAGIPEVGLPLRPGRNLALWVECFASKRLLELEGYHAAEDLIARQARCMNRRKA